MESRIKSLTPEERKELMLELAADEKKEQQRRTKERQEYEKARDVMVQMQIAEACEISGILIDFKARLEAAFNFHEEKLNEYGGIRSNSKGGFSLPHSNGQFRVRRLRATMPDWDERGEKGTELIGDFLKSTIKKRDIKTYEILIGFIQKNDKGDLEYSKVMDLLQHKDKYTDERWVEGLNLIQESYSVGLRSYQYDFQKKNDQGKWENIIINFTSI